MSAKRQITLPDGNSQELRRVKFGEEAQVWTPVLFEGGNSDLKTHPALAVTDNDGDAIFFGDPELALDIYNAIEAAYESGQSVGYDSGWESRDEQADDDKSSATDWMKEDMQNAAKLELQNWRDTHDNYLSEHMDGLLNELADALDGLEP